MILGVELHEFISRQKRARMYSVLVVVFAAVYGVPHLFQFLHQFHGKNDIKNCLFSYMRNLNLCSPN